MLASQYTVKLVHRLLKVRDMMGLEINCNYCYWKIVCFYLLQENSSDRVVHLPERVSDL